MVEMAPPHGNEKRRRGGVEWWSGRSGMTANDDNDDEIPAHLVKKVPTLAPGLPSCGFLNPA